LAPRGSLPTPVGLYSDIDHAALWFLHHTYGRAEVPPKTGNDPTGSSPTTGSSFPTVGNENIRSDFGENVGFRAARPSSHADPIAEKTQKDKPEMVPTFALPARPETTEINPNSRYSTLVIYF